MFQYTPEKGQPEGRGQEKRKDALKGVRLLENRFTTDD
jgi:hypothetical protein